MNPKPQALRHVAVLGAGSWGTALAALASANAATILWARNSDVAQSINTRHMNPAYLPDIALPGNLCATTDFEQAVSHACTGPQPGLIILGVPVAGLSEVCARLARSLTRFNDTRLAIIWICKGFHQESGQLPQQIVQAMFTDGGGTMPAIGLGVLSGPSFAREVALGLPVALTIASKDASVAETVTDALHGGTVRIYTSQDVIGVEVGGALKNVMAIACGIGDGLGLGTNARAALITRGLAEMQRLGVALGGQADTFYGLTGLGDLVLTATGDLSRNRQVGLAVARGQAIDAILASGMTAEGVRCARAARALGQKHGVNMPITEAVCDVLFNGVAPEQAVRDLLARESRAES